MNTPITRLYLGVLVLFALLVGFTSNWSVFEAEQLEAKTENKRPLLEAQQIERGKIFTADGEIIADSRQEGRGESIRYIRQYPQGELFGNPIGYSFFTEGSVGFERAEENVLTGNENEFVSLIDQLRGQVQEGSDIVTTLDSSSQRLATDLLSQQGSPGAVVAIEPQTGAVRTMVSTPGFDPNTVPTDLDQLNQADPSQLFNRDTQATYPPGSTMKVVTAAAALDSGEFTPDTVLNADSPQVFSGVDLNNAGGETADFGDITMTDALTNSVNTYWAQVGEELGPEVLLEYMERFGFLKDPQVELPENQKAPSGVYSGGKLVESGFDIARVAIGQGGEEGQLLATPIQMAEVAATVANAGTLMRPTLVQEIRDPDGRVSEGLDPTEQSEVMSEESAAQLAEMMTNVAEEGTASALSVEGSTFAGKTGTAEINLEGLNQPWFIGFAPVEDPQVAIAVTVERCTGCFGGDTAGPIATAVMSDLLG